MFYKDGYGTKFFEEIPVIGYIPSMIHGIAGNHDHAKRAAAKCTNSVLETGGALIGGVAGGPGWC